MSLVPPEIGDGLSAVGPRAFLVVRFASKRSALDKSPSFRKTEAHTQFQRHLLCLQKSRAFLHGDAHQVSARRGAAADGGKVLEDGATHLLAALQKRASLAPQTPD